MNNPKSYQEGKNETCNYHLLISSSLLVANVYHYKSAQFTTLSALAVDGVEPQSHRVQGKIPEPESDKQHGSQPRISQAQTLAIRCHR